MRKTRRCVFFPFAACAALFLFSGTLAAQGMSPIEVTAITVSPTTCDPGDIVTITISLHNISSKPYSCSGMTAEISAFKATPYTFANRIWHAKQGVGPFAKHEKRNVTFTAKFTVPANLSELHFVAWGPVCPPHEFPYQRNLVLRGPQPKPAEVKLTVCITSHKSAPLNGNRDLHVWVTNHHFAPVENISVSFYVEGKGTTEKTIRLLGVGKTERITRNHSWRTAGTRKLSATVAVAGSKKVWTVAGIHRVYVKGIAVGSINGPHVKCSDGTTRTEAEMK